MSGNGRRMTREQREAFIARAKELRAQGWTYTAIGRELGVSLATVSSWLADPQNR